MRNKFYTALLLPLLLIALPACAANWRESLPPGARVDVQHQGKTNRGLFVLATSEEIVITTRRDGLPLHPAIRHRPRYRPRNRVAGARLLRQCH